MYLEIMGPYKLSVTLSHHTTVCQPVRGDNPRASAGGLSHVQVHRPCYNSSVLTLPSIKYFVLKFAISVKGRINED